MTPSRDFIPRPLGSRPLTPGLSANHLKKRIFRARTEQCDRLTPSCRMPSYDRTSRFGIHLAAGALGLFTPAKAALRFSGKGQHHTPPGKRHLRFPHF
jgi:hypothetical protein